MFREALRLKKYKVGVIGATGMVGQRFMTLLDGHPWFEIAVAAASPGSAGKTYEEAVAGRWAMDVPIPAAARGMRLISAADDVDLMVGQVDFVFCAVNMKKDDIRALEERYAAAECPVISNNSAHRGTPDVPMVIPEVNPEHLAVVASQRKRLGTERGFIAVKANCSIQNYVPAIHPLMDFCPERVLVCTYQGITGAGKTFKTWPEMTDNVIPLIPGEEEKSEREPLKIWGRVENGAIVNASAPDVTAQCVRVPVTDGHMAAVFVSFGRKPDMDVMKRRWAEFSGRPQALGLPSAPKRFLRYFDEPDRPQTGRDRAIEGGMAVSIGRLRADTQYDYKFICLAHNTLRGAAGGGVLLAELLCAEGYI